VALNGMGKEDAALVMLVAVESAFAYSAFLPSVFTIRKHVESDEEVGDIRAGEVLASAFVVILAWITARVIESPIPLYVGALTIGAMVSVYEYGLRNRRGGGL
jgi:hypothetical protein